MSCSELEEGQVAFASAYRSSGIGRSIDGLKSGVWVYDIDDVSRSIHWKKHVSTDFEYEMIVPYESEVSADSRALMFLNDSLRHIRFVITANSLAKVGSLQGDVSLVNSSMRRSDPVNQDLYSFGVDYFVIKGDSIAYGFAAKEVNQKEAGYLLLYRKTEQEIIDFTYRYRLEESASWHQTVFWEMLYSIRGSRRVQLF
jgi:hypothetical protein